MVDELDSGIYEYLLGECLEVMQDKAKGQLIFTSHNLRPLEILENDSSGKLRGPWAEHGATFFIANILFNKRKTSSMKLDLRSSATRSLSLYFLFF